MGSKPSTQTTINKTELPDWVNKAAQENLALADSQANKPYVPYTGQLVAGTSPLQQQSYDTASANNGAFNPELNMAAKTAAQGTQFSYTPTSFLQGNIQQYMNPYTQNVIDRSTANANDALKQNIAGIGDAATAAGAFGGSRHGVAEGVAAAQGARQIGDMSAQLYDQNYNNAVNQFNTDRTTDMTNAYQQQAVRTQSADQLLNTANTGSQINNQNATLLAMLGGQQQNQNQNELTSQYAQWQQQQNYPLQELNLRLAALGATPYGGTQTNTSTATGGNSPGMSLIGGLLGGIGSLFSDRRDKTDIEKLGKDPKTGLDIYAYRYKNDPKNTPKVVGPMAQDVEKKYPHMVSEIGGHKVIHGNLGFGGGLPMKRAA